MQKVKRLTCIPHLDRTRCAAGHDLGTIRREVDGADVVAVGVLFLCLELQSVCGGRKSEFAQRHGSWKSGHLSSRL